MMNEESHSKEFKSYINEIGDEINKKLAKNFSKNKLTAVILKYVSGFGNHIGGELIVGLNDKGSFEEQPDYIYEILNDEWVTEITEKKLNNPPRVEILNSPFYSDDDKIIGTLIKIQVFPSEKLVSIKNDYTYKGIFGNENSKKTINGGSAYIRKQKSTNLMTPEEANKWTTRINESENFPYPYSIIIDSDTNRKLSYTTREIFHLIFNEIFNIVNNGIKFEKYVDLIENGSWEIEIIEKQILQSVFLFVKKNKKPDYKKIINFISNIWENNILIFRINNLEKNKFIDPDSIRNVFNPYKKEMNEKYFSKIKSPNEEVSQLNYDLLFSILNIIFCGANSEMIYKKSIPVSSRAKPWKIYYNKFSRKVNTKSINENLIEIKKIYDGYETFENNKEILNYIKNRINFEEGHLYTSKTLLQFAKKIFFDSWLSDDNDTRLLEIYERSEFLESDFLKDNFKLHEDFLEIFLILKEFFKIDLLNNKKRPYDDIMYLNYFELKKKENIINACNITLYRKNFLSNLILPFLNSMNKYKLNLIKTDYRYINKFIRRSIEYLMLELDYSFFNIDQSIRAGRFKFVILEKFITKFIFYPLSKYGSKEEVNSYSNYNDHNYYFEIKFPLNIETISDFIKYIKKLIDRIGKEKLKIEKFNPILYIEEDINLNPKKLSFEIYLQRVKSEFDELKFILEDAEINEMIELIYKMYHGKHMTM